MTRHRQSRIQRRLLAALPFVVVVVFLALLVLRNLNSPDVSFSPDKKWMLALREPLSAWDPHVDVYYQPSWIPMFLTKQMWFRGRTRNAEPHHFSWQDEPFVVSVWKGGRPRAVLDRNTGRPVSLKTYWNLIPPPEEGVHGNMLTHLINKGFSVQDFLFTAIEAHDLETVKALVEKHGADVNQPKLAPVPAVPLGWAASAGDVAVVSYLLDQGATANCSDPRPFPPICAAGSSGNTEIIELLLQAGAAINSQGGQGQVSALHVAASHGHCDAARLLVARGIDLNLRGSDGSTAQEVAEAFTKSNQPEPFRQACKETAAFLRQAALDNKKDNPTTESNATSG